ncbi:phage virion morphogenesis protein [Desulfoferula mesophila]|uniref:Phage protein, HK97 gp10 family n=1 Tax=Desulfoferula mesophila TaxID=3058419 RepID=A0AAU9ERS3_9BACT|nr:hypothetical protein FAK_15660 [Desulfoferula mesophilus]
MKIDMKIENPEVLEKFRQAHMRLGPEVREAAMKGATLIAGEARENLSGKVLKVQTGRLRASILPLITRDTPDRVTAEVGTNVEYARIHELGGTIKPNRAEWLRFNIPGVGWRSAKEVRIPARPFMGPALEKSLDRIAFLLESAVKRAFE